jgi:hypothetical protein
VRLEAVVAVILALRMTFACKRATEEMRKSILCVIRGSSIYICFHALPEGLRSGIILQAQLMLVPDWLNVIFVVHADTRSATSLLPGRKSLDVEPVEGLINCFNESLELLCRVAWSWCDSQPLFAHGDRGVVDGLDINVMVSEERIRCLLRQCRVADKDRDDVRRTRPVPRFDLAICLRETTSKTHTTGISMSAKRCFRVLVLMC